MLLPFALTVLLCASSAGAQEVPAGPTLQLVRPEGSAGAPIVITLADALQRAKQNDAQFQASVADAEIAREDRVQAKAGLLPAFSYTTQYLGNQPNGVNPNGRFVSLDGVHMYRAWGVVQESSPPTRSRRPRCTEPRRSRRRRRQKWKSRSAVWWLP